MCPSADGNYRALWMLKCESNCVRVKVSSVCAGIFYLFIIQKPNWLCLAFWQSFFEEHFHGYFPAKYIFMNLKCTCIWEVEQWTCRAAGGPSRFLDSTYKLWMPIFITFLYWYEQRSSKAAIDGEGGPQYTALGVLMSQIIRQVRAMHGRAARLIPI